MSLFIDQTDQSKSSAYEYYLQNNGSTFSIGILELRNKYNLNHVVVWTASFILHMIVSRRTEKSQHELLLEKLKDVHWEVEEIELMTKLPNCDKKVCVTLDRVG